MNQERDLEVLRLCKERECESLYYFMSEWLTKCKCIRVIYELLNQIKYLPKNVLNLSKFTKIP